MISPAGTRRDQICQGPSKYSSIWDSDILKRIAQHHMPGADDEELDDGLDDGMPESNTDNLSIGEPQTQTTQDPGVDTDALQQAMMQGNNPGMNQTQTGGGVNHRDFGIIANELSDFIQGSDALSQTYILVNQQRDQKTGKWRFEIEPTKMPEMQAGPMVDKNEPYSGPVQNSMGQQQQPQMQPAMASTARVQRTGG